MLVCVGVGMKDRKGEEHDRKIKEIIERKRTLLFLPFYITHTYKHKNRNIYTNTCHTQEHVLGEAVAEICTAVAT